jgi:photosystem II stability/assembly factor-like uncharacterized protein
VFKSTDGGATWSGTSLGSTVWALAIDPQNPNILYAGTESFYGGGVFKSTDGGATWSGTSLTRTVWALAIDPQNPNILYAGAYGVFKSTDGGATWSEFSDGLTDYYIYALAVNPQYTNIVYAGTRTDGVFKTMPKHRIYLPLILRGP